MGKKLLSLFNREFTNIHSAALLISIATFGSQILALLRDRSFAYAIGPTRALDIYYAAFRIPDLLFNSFATLVSITALLPFIIQLVSSTKDDEEEAFAQQFFKQVFTVFLIIMIVLSILLFICMPFVVRYVAPGFDPESLSSLVGVSRIMLLSPILLGLSNLFQSITQLYKKFFVYALSPILYNLGIIVSIYLFYPMFGVYGLAIGVVLGAFLHMIINVPVLIKHGFNPHITTKVSWKKIGELFIVSLPRTLALSLNSIAIFALTSIASTLGAGSISIFTLGFNLQSVPISIIGLSYGVAAFPLLAEYFKKQDYEKYISTVVTTAKQIIFYSIPVMVLFIVLRAHIVRVILGAGAFNWDHTRLTAASLALFTIGIIGQCFIILFVRAYYAAGKTRRPLVINILFTASEILFAYLLMHLFNNSEIFRYTVESLLRVSGIKETSVLMLSLGYAIGTLLNGVLLWWLFRIDFIKQKETLLFKPFLRSMSASLLAGFVTYYVLQIVSPHIEQTKTIGILSQGFFAGVLGIISWFIVHVLVKSPELLALKESLKNKLSKNHPVIAEEQ